MTHLRGLASAGGASDDLEMAHRDFETAIHHPSRQVRLEARFRLARIERRYGNLATAAALLRQVIEQRPDASIARLELARVLAGQGHQDEARRQAQAVRHAGRSGWSSA